MVETYGSLNADNSNAVLVCHALSGDHHAAGYHESEPNKPGWWNHYIGPGKCIDTDRFLLSASIISEAVRGLQVLCRSILKPAKPTDLHFQKSRFLTGCIRKHDLLIT